ncbi:nucleotidyltransferase family protein [uncultured Paraglaciecola sp.]|uniref:nucleotidyltransferase family protein n=1 Tax=uncultured Paraglaciecola sp. TaxID=1765024 RepID=UPI00259942CB|nr:nucleotidyltransferase family protein [uncultured Paraglaciecola sp.]
MKTELLLLAAGKSRRFNGIKQLADINGQVMVCHCLSAYQQDGKWLEDIAFGTVILGANAKAVAKVLPITVNAYIAQSWEQGMGHSLAESIGVLSRSTTHVLVGLADQIAIRSLAIKALLEASKQHPQKIIAAEYQDKAGVPAIFPKAFFSQLSKLQGDKGARDILQNNNGNVIKVTMSEAVIDIDTQDDLLRLAR